MKKTFANIRTLTALLIASAALTACSNDDGIIDNAQPAQQQAQHVYTLTIQAGKADDAQTRALEASGTGLTAKWAATDQVTVTKGTTSLGTLSIKAGSISADGQTCTFTGELTGEIATGDVLTLTYHPVTDLSSYAQQTGTLASAANYDVATASVTVNAVDNGTKTITTGTATFATRTAVLKITMKDGSDNALNATSLKISAGGTDIFTFYPIAEATYTANGNGVLYFALPSAATLAAAKSISTTILAAQPVTFTATVGSDTYTATKTGYPFAAGTYYTTTLTMAIARPLAEATAEDLGKIAGADGNIYDTKDAASTAGTTAVAMIAYVGSDTDHATYKHGLAIALADEASTMNWNTAKSTCEDKTAVSGAAWQLPSQNQWKAMFKAFGDNDGSYTGLNTALAAAGGDSSKLREYEEEDDYYWSSEYGGENARCVYLGGGVADWYVGNTALEYRVRACLAF